VKFYIQQQQPVHETSGIHATFKALDTRKDKFTYQCTLIAVIFLISVLSVRVEWSKQKAVCVHH